MRAKDLIKSIGEIPQDAEILSVKLEGESKIEIVFTVMQKKQYTEIDNVCSVKDIE